MDDEEAQLLRAVGRRVAELRVGKGLTQEQFAVELGKGPKWIQLIEQGGQNMSLLTLRRLAVALGVPMHELLVKPKSLEANPGRPRLRPKA